MKHPKRQILVFTISLILLSCVIVMSSFNFMMQRYIKNEAMKTISKEIESYKPDNNSFYDQNEYSLKFNDFMQVNMVYLVSNEVKDNLTNREKSLVMYCENNPGNDGEIRFASFNDNGYYIAQLHLKDGYYIENTETKNDFENYGQEGIAILYVNITPFNLISKSMNNVFLVVLLAFALLSGCMGIRLGKQIENSQEKLKQFFQNVSHELKTPIMSIQGYAEGIQTKVIKDQTMATQIIIDESQKMSDLVEELIYISKVDSGQVTIKKEPIEINELIYDCLRSLGIIAKNKGIEIKIDFGQASPIIYGSEKQLAKAFTNIIINALKYAQSQVSIKCHYNKKYIEIVISDDGDGISEKDLPHVFERFYTGEKGNTGIGLALTKEIIAVHNGKITAVNSDKGAVFNIILRLKK